MEEISLRELIEILLKRKTMIIGITILAVLISAVVSFALLEPVYETKMVLMASNFSERLQPNQFNSEGIDNILDSLSRFPDMTLETYKQQIKAPRIMRQTIADLGLEDIYDIETLAKKIELETIKDTNLITIKMKDNDPEKAASIVNKVGEEFVSFVSDKAKEQATASSSYIEAQMVFEKEKLDEALIELRNYLAQPKGTEELKRELEAKLTQITEFKTENTNSQMRKDVLEKSIGRIEQQIINTDKKLITNKTILDDPLMKDLVEENTNSSTRELAGIKVESEEINPVYLELETALNTFVIELAEVDARLTNLQGKINETQFQIETLQAELAEKEHEERIIRQKVDVAQNTYNAFVEKHEELRVTESSQIGESNMIVISKAYPTTQPVGPRKVLNVAIAAVLGLMISVFAAFFIEYWNSEDKDKIAKNHVAN
ncbi:GumC family protein [Alkaliphilus serpentinus]|uniref:Lipopolysaccharide biosynthesis protein n=1 Tax=Alkaliphilus serpentinus TaxID=1482731 RepID=A0A833MDV6_9FIRM|nr:GNVR domain-containing protein [Alkaliphilus serpentinus]KAB3529715.1 hypothetical protein F8153_08940 [Alkaliphilus serpentinus]